MFRRGFAAIAAAVLLLTGCSAQSEPEVAESDVPAVVATPSASTPAPSPAVTPEPVVGAADAFRAWLAASRIPDTEAACAGIAPDLVTRMLTEMSASGIDASTCEEMVTITADLYRSLDQSADIDVEVQAESATDATLLVTYTDAGDCATVAMQRQGDDWIITNQSQEVCQ